MKYTVATTLVLSAVLGSVLSMQWKGIDGSGGKLDFIQFNHDAGAGAGLQYLQPPGTFGDAQGYIKRHGGGDYEGDSHDPKFIPQPVKVIRVYVPKPIPVAVPKPFTVKVPKPYAVYIPVQQRVEVPVIKHVQVKVDKPYHVTVEKHVPQYVEKPYPITVEKHVFYDVPKPYPVHVPVYKHVYLGHGHGH